MPNIEPPNTSPPEDPRIALAAAQLAEARAKLEEKEAETRRSRPTLSLGRHGKLAGSASKGALFFSLLAVAAVTLAIFVFICWLQMMSSSVVFGLVTFPVALIMIAFLLSFVSSCYLAVIESTSNGKVEIELQADPREWFWTLPSALFVVFLTVTIAWGVSLLLPDHQLLVMLAVYWLLYPFLQLSVLETGKLVNPFSGPVVRSLVEHPLAWIAMYLASALLDVVLAITLRIGLFELVSYKMLIRAPVIGIVLLCYGWLLGQLVHFIRTADDSH